jgi:hypothetical protein
MGRFLVAPRVVAVCSERLVATIDIAPEGIVTVRDLATAQIYTTSAGNLTAPPRRVASMGGVLNINEVSAARCELAQRRKEAIASIDGTQNVSSKSCASRLSLGFHGVP